jgi:CubicO group peptidase (beta-lactamase class C family)
VTTAIELHGQVAPGWEPVADAFRRNFEEHNELGAAVAVYRSGQPVVDLWAGVADARTAREWERDTVALVMSTTKGATGICIHLLVQRGLLDVDAPIARYWPEFGQAGKQDITLRLALSQQAGLHYVDADLSFDEFCAYEPVIRAIERQAPHHAPGTRAVYHPITFGHIAQELVARVTGQTLGQFFAAEVAAPLDLRSWIGLPADLENSVAPLHRDADGPREPADKAADKLIRAITFGSALPISLVSGTPNDFNSRAVRAIELGGSNMVTDARGLARLYASTVSDVDGVRLLSADTVRAAIEVQTTHLPGFDFSVGFTTAPFLLGASSFGWGGAGGSLGFADIEHEVGFGYVMNRMDAVTPDVRAIRLAAAVRICLTH